MEIAHDNLSLPWALSYKIPLQQSGVQHKGKRMYVHRFGWVLFARKSGKRQLTLPALALDFGRYQVKLPAYSLMVKALPLYLNPDAVVGRITLHLQSTPGFWLQHQYLYRFRLVVTAPGVPRQWLPAAQTWLAAKNHARYYVQQASSRTTINHKGLVTTVVVDAAMTPVQTGWYSIVNTTVRYFDPLQSSWINESVRTGTWFSMPGWLYWLLALVLLVLVIRFLWIAGRCVTGLLVLFKKQYRLKRQIRLSDRDEEFLSFLHTMLAHYGINSRLPDKQLYQRWVRCYGENHCLRKLLDMNVIQRFASPGSRPDLIRESCKKQLLAMLHWRLIVTNYFRARGIIGK